MPGEGTSLDTNTKLTDLQKEPSFIKSKEKIEHMKCKVDGAKKSLEQSKKAESSHKRNLQELESELRNVERNNGDIVSGPIFD